MNAAHPVSPEDLMAYLDGEAAARAAREIQAHLGQCVTCQQRAADLREGSIRMREWRIEEAPASLMSPQPRVRGGSTQKSVPWRVWKAIAGRPLMAAVATLVVVAAASVSLLQPAREPMAIALSSREMPAVIEMPETLSGRTAGRPAFRSRAQSMVSQGVQGNPAQVSTSPRIVRTATLRIVANDFEATRPAIDRMLQSVGGFVGQITASDSPGATRSIRASLRVPGAQLGMAVGALRRLGRVIEESQGADDVTVTVTDLDVRLANARVTEKRLSELLRNRTGAVSDVLEVEREMARVRTDIEQMDAERTQLNRRIEYATITLEVVEERAAAVDLGPVPVPARLSRAIADGLTSAMTSILEATLAALRVGPAVLLWATMLGVPAWLLKRRYAR